MTLVHTVGALSSTCATINVSEWRQNSTSHVRFQHPTEDTNILSQDVQKLRTSLPLLECDERPQERPQLRVGAQQQEGRADLAHDAAGLRGVSHQIRLLGHHTPGAAATSTAASEGCSTHAAAGTASSCTETAHIPHVPEAGGR